MLVTIAPILYFINIFLQVKAPVLFPGPSVISFTLFDLDNNVIIYNVPCITSVPPLFFKLMIYILYILFAFSRSYHFLVIITL